jgi:hypothetical protein
VKRARLKVRYVRDLGRGWERPQRLEVPSNSPYLITISVRALSLLHLESPRIWVTFPRTVRVILDLLKEHPEAKADFPLGDLNADRSCILDHTKPPTYDNLCYARQPEIKQVHQAYYDPFKLDTTLQSNDDFILSVWIETGPPVNGKIEVEARPLNMTKRFIADLRLSVVEGMVSDSR